MHKSTYYIENMIRAYPDLAVCEPEVKRTFEILRDCYRKGGKVLICGNGGSAADSEHIVGELMKGYFSKRPVPQEVRDRFAAAFPAEGDYLANHLQGALPTLSLVSQTSLITAFANDVAAELIFAQQVYGYGVEGDVLIGISTSGTSQNVVYALQVAQVMGLGTIGLTGRSGGKMKALCEVTVCVPAEITPEVQQRHIAVYHTLCGMLEEEFFPA
jgi:D-sedoheptulose 7-phosphate isomerase